MNIYRVFNGGVHVVSCNMICPHHNNPNSKENGAHQDWHWQWDAISVGVTYHKNLRFSKKNSHVIQWVSGGYPSSYPICGVPCGVARGLGERLGNLKLCCPYFCKYLQCKRFSVTRDEFELV